MPALREIVESLGHTDVETYLQSGNVVFTPRGRGDHAAELSAAIAEATGLDVAVVVRTGKQLAAVVERNPYPVDDPTRVVVAFLAEKVEPGRARRLAILGLTPRRADARRARVYVSVPNGQARSKLMEALTKRRQPTTAHGAELANRAGAGGDDLGAPHEGRG